MVGVSMDSLRVPAFAGGRVRAKSVIFGWFLVVEVFSSPGFGVDSVLTVR